MAIREAVIDDDLAGLRWAHERLGEMGYPPEADHCDEHPIDWWEHHPATWAAALEAQAGLAVEVWDANCATLAAIATKRGA